MIEQITIVIFIISHVLIYGWKDPLTWPDYCDQKLMDFIKSLSEE